jgi:hypothetical protein
MFLRHELDDLLACEAEPAVSLYLSTHTAGREIRQDPIRLRQLLGQAAERLAESRRPAEIEELLAPARRLLDGDEFWRHQEQGLAIFLGPDFARIHKLPIEVAEELTVAAHFRIRPLLALVESDQAFWLLSISAGHTRLFQGSRWTFAEITGLELPQGVEEIYRESDLEEDFKARPTARPQRGVPTAMAKSQALETPEDVRKAQLIELLHRIAARVEPALKRQPAPIVLAAQPENQGNFRDFAPWKELLQQGILSNPDAMPLGELHRKAWALVAPDAEKRRADEVGRLKALIASGEGKASSKPEEIVKAAHYARIDRLFLSDSALLWGRFDPAEERIVVHGEPIAGDSDLFDYAALMTLRQGGAVSLVERSDLPPDGPAAAILRY